MIEIFRDIHQGSDEWLELRRGVITASNFKHVMAKGKKKGSPSITRRKYMLKLLGERLTGDIEEGYKNHHMESGNLLEDEARQSYSMIHGIEVEQVTFIKNRADIGYSPDGVIGEPGLLEIKKHIASIQLAIILGDTKNPENEHKQQIQGGLWVSEREWLDFVSYSPKLEMSTIRVYRDEEYIKEIKSEVFRFLGELRELEEKLS